MADSLHDLVYRAIQKLRVRYWSPTRAWPPGTLTQLSYDMRPRTLNGLPLGAPLERLKPLGPADSFDRYRPALKLYYYRLGLIVDLWEGRVSSFEVLLDPPNCPDRAWHPFLPGRIALVSPAGERRDLARTTTETEVVALLGAPVETGPIAGQPMHTFIAAGNIVNTTHDPGTGRLVRVDFGEAAEDSAAASGSPAA